MSQIKASAEFLSKAYDLALEYGYTDEPQENLLKQAIEGVIEDLKDSGVPIQEEKANYLTAVYTLAAYRYNRRTTVAMNMGANDEDKGYTSMVRNWVWKLRKSVDE